VKNHEAGVAGVRKLYFRVPAVSRVILYQPTTPKYFITNEKYI